MPALMLNFPEGETTRFEVTGEKVTFGRGLNNAICVRENHVSSFHAEFQLRSDGVYDLVDLDSHNGTYVNGARLTGRQRLQEGDRLVFGMIEGKFLAEAGDDLQLTQGIEIAFLRTAEAIRLNPELAHAAAELKKVQERAESIRGLSPPVSQPTPTPTLEAQSKPAPRPPLPRLAPAHLPPPRPRPAMAPPPSTPTPPGKRRPILSATPPPAHSSPPVQTPPPVQDPPRWAGPPPVAFLPAPGTSPFTESGPGSVLRPSDPAEKKPSPSGWASLLNPFRARRGNRPG